MEKPNLQREESGTHAARRKDGQGETRETEQQSLLLKWLHLRPICPPVLQLYKALEVFILHGIEINLKSLSLVAKTIPVKMHRSRENIITNS